MTETTENTQAPAGETQSQQSPASTATVQSAELSEVTQSKDKGSGGSIDILLDMTVPITVTIGHTSIPVRRLLQLGPGSVITLDNAIEEPVELYLQDSKFAMGDIVVVDNHFAVRIKQILGVTPSAQTQKKDGK